MLFTQAVLAPSARVAPAVLAAGVIAVSTASILIRWLQAEGVPSLAIAAWRLALAAVLLGPFVLVHARSELARLSPREWLLGVASGALLAAHFAAWIVSLEYTSVASSVALVTTNPIWIGIASFLFFRERLGGAGMLGIACAIAGSAVIFLTDAQGSGDAGAAPALGNALALIGSLTICGHFLLGRRLRRTMSLIAYIGLVYSAAAVCLIAIAAVTGAPLIGYGGSAWVWLALLAVGPQLIGHSGFNWALRYLPATMVAVVILGEPVGSTILAWLVLDEPVGPTKLGGMGLLLTGILLAVRERNWRT